MFVLVSRTARSQLVKWITLCSMSYHYYDDLCLLPLPQWGGDLGGVNSAGLPREVDRWVDQEQRTIQSEGRPQVRHEREAPGSDLHGSWHGTDAALVLR